MGGCEVNLIDMECLITIIIIVIANHKSEELLPSPLMRWWKWKRGVGNGKYYLLCTSYVLSLSFIPRQCCHGINCGGGSLLLRYMNINSDDMYICACVYVCVYVCAYRTAWEIHCEMYHCVWKHAMREGHRDKNSSTAFGSSTLK